MQIARLCAHSLYRDEAPPIETCERGTVSAITRNGRLLESRIFGSSSHMASLWRMLWDKYGEPAGHPDRPYITIKRGL